MVKNTLLNYIFKTRALYIQTLAMTTYFFDQIF